MLIQFLSDLYDRIVNDAKTITDLQSQVADLKQQLSDAMSTEKADDEAIAKAQQEAADAKAAADAASQKLAELQSGSTAESAEINALVSKIATATGMPDPTATAPSDAATPAS